MSSAELKYRVCAHECAFVCIKWPQSPRSNVQYQEKDDQFYYCEVVSLSAKLCTMLAQYKKQFCVNKYTVEPIQPEPLKQIWATLKKPH